MTACSHAPATLSNPNQYVRIGVLPGYEPEIVKRTPPTFSHSEIIEHLKLGFSVNQLVVDRVMKSVGQARQMVDLQSFSAAYVAEPKVHSWGERKIFGDSRPMFSDVVKSTVGAKGLDAYLVIEGGPVRLHQAQTAPVIQMFVEQPHLLAIQLTIFVVDGRTFEVAAMSSVAPVEGVPDPWFFDPMQHADEIRNAVVAILDRNLQPLLRKLRLI